MKHPMQAFWTAVLLVWGLAGLGAPPAAASIANSEYVVAPAVVSAGMANVLVYVPEQTGATYHWSVKGGSIPGTIVNAAMYFNAGAVGTVTVQCVISLYGTQLTCTQDIPVVPVLPVDANGYGSQLRADDLANTVLGGPSAQSVSYRFQALHSSPLRSIQVFFIWSQLKSGYAAGQGGTIRVDLLADDGTGSHLPTGPVLATLTCSSVLSANDYYPKLPFPYPASLTGGRIYHLVFTNIDPAPAANYVSLDSLWTDAQTSPMQPSLNDYGFATLMRAGTGPWKLRQGFTPILELDYADGSSQGKGYVEVWRSNPKIVSGATQVRETFKVKGPNRLFSKVMIRAERLAGSSPLTLRLTEADGTLIEQAAVPAASVLQGAYDWVTCTFPLTHVLASGVGYNLTLSAPADTQYSTFPMRKALDKGFSTATVFSDGYAQVSTNGGTSWAGWDMWGTPNLTTSDLQFMFIP